MEILVDRKWKKPTYTIGNLYINGKKFCNTIEDTDRGLNSNMDKGEIIARKKPTITAIPTGTYEITLDVISPKFGSKPFYKEVCDGKLPRLLNVKGFDGVLIHCGNSAEDSSGCIIIGKNLEVGKVLQSRETFKALYSLLLDSKKKGEKITIIIK